MFPPPLVAEPVEGGAGALAGTEEGEEQVEIDSYSAKIQKARDIAQADPKVVANIIKDWMGVNAT